MFHPVLRVGLCLRGHAGDPARLLVRAVVIDIVPLDALVGGHQVGPELGIGEILGDLLGDRSGTSRAVATASAIGVGQVLPVRNTPLPATTESLPIGRLIATRGRRVR